ncbi:MAG: ATPase [Clostridia bacterium]|nr:ATPase [Clostridia bacterium]
MIVYERLAYLEKMIAEGKKLPLSEKVIIDKTEALEIFKEIKTALPDELKQAKWISDERKKIIVNAHMEADQIINDAKEKVNEHEITKMAEEHAEKLLAAAREEAAEIRDGSRKYADSLLTDIQDKLVEINEIIDRSRDQLKE